MAYSARNVGSTGERVALDIVSWSSSEEAKAKASERAEAAVHLAEMLGHRVHVKSRPGLYACTIEDDTGEHEMVAMQLSHRSKDVWFVPTNPRAAKEFHHVFGLEWKNIDLTTRHNQYVLNNNGRCDVTLVQVKPIYDNDVAEDAPMAFHFTRLLL
jgi:hypothetical protein